MSPLGVGMSWNLVNSVGLSGKVGKRYAKAGNAASILYGERERHNLFQDNVSTTLVIIEYVHMCFDL